MTKPVAVMSMLHEAADVHSAVRRFRDKPVLDWTLRRLSAAGSIGQRIILAWDDQVSTAEPVAGAHGAAVVTVGKRQPIPSMDAVTTARRWADGWRGGPLQTCEFDRGFHAPSLHKLAVARDADAVVLVDPAAGLVDPQLIDGMVKHAGAHTALPLIFSSAAPGLSGVLIRTSLLAQLASLNTHAGKYLHYQPTQPTRDPISELNCAPVPTPVARTTHRFTLDSSRQIAKLSAATVQLNGELPRADAATLVSLVCGISTETSMPREIVLELTTRRATQPIFSPVGHLTAERADMTTADAFKVIEQFKAGLDTFGERRLILGGVGDPLLASNLFEVIHAAASAGLAVHVRTDLVGVSAEMVAQLADTPIDLISIQIPAVTARTYLAVMGIDGLNQVIENVKLFVQRRGSAGRATPILMPVFTKCRENLAEMETWYDRWLGALGSAVIQGPTDYAGQIADHSVADMTPPSRQPCRQIFSRLHVLCDSRVVPCEQDFRGVAAVGTIDESISKIWSHPLGQLRDDHLNKDVGKHPLCSKCRHWHRP